MTRSFMRVLSEDPTTPSGTEEALREALAEDGVAYLFDHDQVALCRPALELRRAGPAVVLIARGGRCVGVFGDPMRAAEHGLRHLDREAAARAAALRKERGRRGGQASRMRVQAGGAGADG